MPLLFVLFPTLLLMPFGLDQLPTQARVTQQAPAFAALGFQMYLAVLQCTALPVASIVASHTKARILLIAHEELLQLVLARSFDAIIGLDGSGVCRWAVGRYATTSANAAMR